MMAHTCVDSIRGLNNTSAEKQFAAHISNCFRAEAFHQAAVQTRECFKPCRTCNINEKELT